MILREMPTGPRLFFILQGSILPRILPPLLGNAAIAIAVTLTHGVLLDRKITLTTIPFSLIGIALAIFLGFRNTAAYDRFWEARKLWGDIVSRSRNLTRQCLSMVDDPAPARAANGLDDLRVRMIYRAIALTHAIRHLLRNSDAAPDILPFLQPQEWEQFRGAAHGPDFLLRNMGADLRLAMASGRLDSYLAASIDSTLSSLTTAIAGCERIRSTPIPFTYSLLLHRTAYLYCFLLPFGLVDSIGFMTPIVVLFVTYTFFGLDALGGEIEQPFGTSPNALSLDAICRSIEINLREAVKDDFIPAVLQPVNGCLS